MLRSVARTQLQLISRCRGHGLASTVLLSKTYDDKTVSELREEARRKGLPVSGNKATLITRIQQDDKRAALEAIASAPASPVHTRIHARNISSSPAVQAGAATGGALRSTLDVKLPDLSAPAPEMPIQIPFYPDSWDSFKIKTQGKASGPSEGDAPKIVLTAGAATHAVSPTFGLEQADDNIHEAESPLSSSSGPSKPTGVFGDIIADLGIPPDLFLVKDTKHTEAIEIDTTEELGSAKKSYSRPLDADEQTGVYNLLWILFGSWVAASLASPKKRDEGPHWAEDRTLSVRYKSDGIDPTVSSTSKGH